MDGLDCRPIAPPTVFLLQDPRTLDSKYHSNSEGALGFILSFLFVVVTWRANFLQVTL